MKQFLVLFATSLLWFALHSCKRKEAIENLNLTVIGEGSYYYEYIIHKKNQSTDTLYAMKLGYADIMNTHLSFNSELGFGVRLDRSKDSLKALNIIKMHISFFDTPPSKFLNPVARVVKNESVSIQPVDMKAIQVRDDGEYLIQYNDHEILVNDLQDIKRLKVLLSFMKKKSKKGLLKLFSISAHNNLIKLKAYEF